MTVLTVRRQAGAGAVFALAVVLAALVGALASTRTAQDYARLAQPSWAPPAWVFGPVWAALYASIAVAGWLVWLRAGASRGRGALIAYGVQLALNAAWTPIFFGLRQFGAAFAEVVALWLAIAVTVVLFARIQRAAAALLLPYWAWTTFAAALTFAVWRLNP
ncbi:TspO/MBR family protein [Kutzneria buriramensis]|uniref:Tryptophan-rich sensory protein n=1 Tax=Kutzneria buriramensis TaxID=1045776 RepID=A0A3E0GYR4_9PSEU|nr:TspO/MBR family protein [Kutzneria buriramensis]REH34901.1 tryptophan-rich sensory protein [Kutzneria buriramensis]